MKRFLLPLLIVLIQPRFTSAAELSVDQPTRQYIQTVMQHIYDDVIQVKDKYPELANFNESVIRKDANGLDKINYEYQDPRIKSKNNIYAFSLEIIGLSEEPAEKEGYHEDHTDYPALKLRFLVYSRKNSLWHRHSVQKVFDKYSDEIFAYQQKYLPIELILTPGQDSFKENEKITVEVMVKNASSRIYDVKDLNNETVYCTLNGSPWGIVKSPTEFRPAVKDIRLNPGDTFKRRFVGSGLERPGQVELDCSYNVSYEGIRPEGTSKVTIVP